MRPVDLDVRNKNQIFQKLAEMMTKAEADPAEVDPGMKGKPFDFNLKPLAAHTSHPRVLHEMNQERQDNRRIMEFMMLKALGIDE